MGLRAACMQSVLVPLAKRWGISKRKDAVRFSEQGWILLYYSIMWPLGVVRFIQVSNYSVPLKLTVSSISTISRRIFSTYKSYGPIGHRESLMGLRRHMYWSNGPSGLSSSLSSTWKLVGRTTGRY